MSETSRDRHPLRSFCLGPMFALLVAGCMSTAAGPLATQDENATRTHPEIIPDMVDAAQLNPGIPAPEFIIGHGVGEKAVRYEALIRYLRILTDSSEFVTMTQYATSHEGRALYYLTITSPENRARLDQIKVDNAKLADPRTLASQEEAEGIIETLPGIAWLAYSIHGDEMSGVDSSMQVAYLLAAGQDEATKKLRDELVIHIDPTQNPDGRERFLSQIYALQGKVANPDMQAMHHAGLWAAGRGNHYLFDMNRDWLIQSQPETRGRTDAINDWNPHFLIDAHEMSSTDTFLMDPPRDPINNHLSETMFNWRKKFGTDQARAFNQRGWSYYSGDWYEEWYPGYTNAYASLRGTIGLLYEQASLDGSQIKKPSGEIETYTQAVAHNVTGTFANLNTLRENREAILRDFLGEKQWAISDGDQAGRTFILPPDDDDSRRNQFLDLLDRHEIEYLVADGPFSAFATINTYGEKSEEMAFPAGTVVVKASQPFRRYLNAILEFDPRLNEQFLRDEREELENGLGGRIYDMTAWSTPMAFGLDAYWAERIAGDFQGVRREGRPAPAIFPDVPAYGYLIDGRDSKIYQALAALFDADCKPRIATKPFTHNGMSYQSGSVLLRGHENPDSLRDVLKQCAGEFGIRIMGAETALSEQGPDLGGPTFRLLQSPRVAIASQWPMSTSSFGFVWYQLDQVMGLRCSPINVQSLGRMDLRKYNVLILPSGGAVGAVLRGGALQNVRKWVEAGGTLIAVGNSASALANEDSGLSSVRRLRDVLDKLDEYEEALEYEQSAQNIEINPAEIWGDQPPAADSDDTEIDTSDKESKEKSSPKGDALKRLDQRRRIFSPRGIIVATTVNPLHWLSYGLPERLPALFNGSNVLMSKSPVATPVRLQDASKVRMSGLLWPEARQRIANSAYATVERKGNGQVILFANDPFHRAYFQGTGRLMLNAVLLGPGLGANQPIPW